MSWEALLAAFSSFLVRPPYIQNSPFPLLRSVSTANLKRIFWPDQKIYQESEKL